MGRLTAAQIAAITSEAQCRQTWAVYVPRAAGSTTYDATVIHDDDGGPERVTDAGSRIIEGYNVSMADPGNLTSGQYTFRARNDDGYLSPTVSGNVFYNSTGSYQASPFECHIEHKLYVWSAGAWSELLSYRGVIEGASYDDNNDEATLQSVALAAVVMRSLYTVDDGTEIDTGMDVYL